MKEHIRPSIIANEIRMARAIHEGAFCIVEGEDDKKFLKRFTDGGTCRIIIAYGKSNAVVALAILEAASFQGVLALLDADFSVLEGESPQSSNIVLTDTHDIETLLLKSPALDKVLLELASEGKLALYQSYQGDLRDGLLRAGLPIGYLRWVSSRERIPFRFTAFRFTRFIDEKTLEVDTRLLVQTVKNHSQYHALHDDYLMQKINDLKHPDHDPWHVCCGHDLVEILSISLRKALGSHNDMEVRPERLAIHLRLAYEHAYFNKTELRAAVRKWEQANPSFSVLSQPVTT